MSQGKIGQGIWEMCHKPGWQWFTYISKADKPPVRAANVNGQIRDRINVLFLPCDLTLPTIMKPIRSSDIGSYLYCRRAWWYRLHGQASINQAEMAAGTELHSQHGRVVMLAGLLRSLAFFLLLLACVLLTAFALTNFLSH
jgi:hypothetical protein